MSTIHHTNPEDSIITLNSDDEDQEEIPKPPAVNKIPTSTPTTRTTSRSNSDERLPMENLTDRFILGREESQRRDPWFRAMSVRQILPAIYQAITTSENVRPFQLLSFGRSLLTFLNDQVALGGDWEHENYLEIFDAIFSRIVTMQFGSEDGYEEFLDSVWNLHNNGPVSFKYTSIPEKLVQVCPSRLEEVVNTSLNTSLSGSSNSESTTPIVFLCENNPENFLKVSEILCTKFNSTNDSTSRKKILNFASTTFNSLQNNLQLKYYSIFPSPFHPLIQFVTAVIENDSVLRSDCIFENRFVVKEVLSLLNNLYYQSELCKLNVCTVTFILSGFPQVSSVIRNVCVRNPKLVLYKKWPWLKGVVGTDEFLQFF